MVDALRATPPLPDDQSGGNSFGQKLIELQVTVSRLLIKESTNENSRISVQNKQILLADVVGAFFDEQNKQLTVVAYPPLLKNSRNKVSYDKDSNALPLLNNIDDDAATTAVLKRKRLRQEYHFSLLRMYSRSGANSSSETVLVHEGRQWASCLNCLLDGQAPKEKEPAAEEEDEENDREERCEPVWEHRRRKLLILINPFGGSGKAEQVYRKECHEMLVVRFDVKVHVTARANEAREMMANMPADEIAQYSTNGTGGAGGGVVVVGGDGLVFEVVNGLAERSDAANVLPCTVIGHVPGGSGNGLCSSILHAAGEEMRNFDPLHATFLIAKGGVKKLDLALVEGRDAATGTHYTMPSFLAQEWAFIADLDIESEKYRCCGPDRFVFYALERICCLRRYSGRLSYEPWQKRGDAEDSSIYTSERFFNDLAGSGGGSGGKQPVSVSDSSSALLPSLDSAVPDHWETIEGAFTMLWACGTSHQATDSHMGKGVELSDGKMRLAVVQAIGRCDLLKAFLDPDSEHAAKHIRFIETRAYRLEPFPHMLGSDGGGSASAGGRKKGILAVDGEKIDYGPIQCAIYQAVASVFG